MDNNAIYEFFWYELDQSLKVGESKDFHFYKDSNPLKFSDGLCKKDEYIIKNCTISSIIHPELGKVIEINTKGLDYTIMLNDGAKIIVNSEENPGNVYNSDSAPKKWKFDVLLSCNT